MVYTFFRKLGRLAAPLPLLMILLLVALCTFGICVIYSATFAYDALKNSYSSQFNYAILGFCFFFFFALIPYRFWVEWAPYLFGAALLLLILAYLPGFGRKVYGAHSWVRLGPISFEPGEFAKIAYILFIAAFLKFRQDTMDDFWENLFTFLMVLVFTIIPFLLIYFQPALGSAMVFFPVCFFMLFCAGIRWYFILTPVILVAALVGAAYLWVHVWDKKVPILKEYQTYRIKVFFDPSLDPKKTGWQANQSIIAIGTGGWGGKGWRQGTQHMLGYVPNTTSYNDMVFPVVGEDFGFRGGALLILGEGAILLWCLYVAGRARDKIGALVAVGVMAMLFTHVFVNIGMTIQLVPITGIPLPFISYGGTFLIACLAALGLVQSVWVHRGAFDRA